LGHTKDLKMVSAASLALTLSIKEPVSGLYVSGKINSVLALQSAIKTNYLYLLVYNVLFHFIFLIKDEHKD